jgi:hypothetical protein
MTLPAVQHLPRGDGEAVADEAAVLSESAVALWWAYRKRHESSRGRPEALRGKIFAGVARKQAS